MSDVTDIATALIAFAALGTSLHQLRAAAKDRRIAVRPHIAFTRIVGDRSLKILMQNTGLGPAKIVHFSFSANGKHYAIRREADIGPLWKDSGINGCKLDFFAHITPGDYFPVGGELRVMELSQIEPYPGEEAIFSNGFEALNVHVKYRSLYDEDFVAKADLPVMV